MRRTPLVTAAVSALAGVGLVTAQAALLADGTPPIANAQREATTPTDAPSHAKHRTSSGHTHSPIVTPDAVAATRASHPVIVVSSDEPNRVATQDTASTAPPSSDDSSTPPAAEPAPAPAPDPSPAPPPSPAPQPDPAPPAPQSPLPALPTLPPILSVATADL